MEDHAEFEYEDRCHLSGKVVSIVFLMISLMTEMILASRWIAEVVFYARNTSRSWF
jgi:hypothetical protein